MSKYTTQLRFICESKSGLTGDELSDADPFRVVEEAAPVIFQGSGVIGDETYDTHIKEQILLHYYTREIGEETYGLWRMRLLTRLREKLTYYNQLYDGLSKQFSVAQDPFLDTDYKKDLSELNASHTAGTDIVDRTGSGTKYSYTDTDMAKSKLGSDTETVDDVLKQTGSGTAYSYTDTGNTHTKTGTDDVDTTENDVAYRLHSDTPEGSIDGLNSEIEGMEGSGFLTDAQKNTDNKTIDTTTTYDTTDTDAGHSDTDSGDTRNYTDDRDVTTTTEYGTVVTDKGSVKTNGGDTRNYEDVRDYSEDRNGNHVAGESIKGKRGSYRSLMSILDEFREKLINLDEVIIQDFSDLFIMLW